ncbi:MAG: DUF899 family protein [Pseudomonadota bacterium]
MALSFPNESTAYRSARDALLQSEIALRQHLEEVAAERRKLPKGGEIPEDYVFHRTDGSPGTLSSLFGPHDTLILYAFMYRAAADARPCPGCTSLLDGWNGQLALITQRAAFACVSSAQPERLQALADARGWSNVRFLSAAGTDYMLRYYGETPDGEQHTFLNVFVRDGATIRHFWGSEIERADLEGHPRHLDTTWPIWGLLDLTPDGRGSFFPDVL